MTIPITTPYYVTNIFISVFVAFFLSVRIYELLEMATHIPLYGFLIGVIIVAIIMLFTHPPVTIGLWIRRLGLIFMVLHQLKTEMDGGLGQRLSLRDLSSSVVVITGATSAIGRAVTNQFVKLNATVIIGCRSNVSCAEVVKLAPKGPKIIGKVIPFRLDLADLHSVKKFASDIKKQTKHVDILINNAGAFVASGARTAQGLEASIGFMHVGHFALTKWLMESLQRPLSKNSNRPSSARIINLVSLGFTFGSFDASILNGTGVGDLRGELTDNCPYLFNFGYGISMNCCPFFACPFSNGYARAKLANILHIHELQRRLDISESKNGKESKHRRVVTASLHPGSVKTEKSRIPIIDSLILRSSDDSANVILHAALDDTFLPGSYIDSMNYHHDLQDYRKKYLPFHYIAYPYAKELPIDKLSIGQSASSLDNWLWNRIKMISSSTNKSLSEVVASPETVAARLYDITNQIVIDFEKKRPLFSTRVLTSTDKL